VFNASVKKGAEGVFRVTLNEVKGLMYLERDSSLAQNDNASLEIHNGRTGRPYFIQALCYREAAHHSLRLRPKESNPERFGNRRARDTRRDHEHPVV
jgi:hypothetical protein